ncbi:MAG: nucleotide exchange factor GrpE [Legionellales bacterium]|nr:nucleotide exchange factor GrpE [Legionellales bacterium]OUX67758.1 MAG: nucleotide exchange factor GrpE [bacterium TMED178]|tara:strand:+ start:1314 stop:1913 length:600 start_codon:yes stop_codon:yes gene_type:complete
MVTKNRAEKEKNQKKTDEPLNADAVAPEASAAFESPEASKDVENKLLKELEGTQQQLKDAMASLKQAQENELLVRADVDNYRKRMEQEVQRSKTFIAQQIVESMLPVVDSLEAALDAAQGNDSVESGLKMTVKLFYDALEKYDVKVVTTDSVAFDPKCHEAMTAIEKDGVESGQIIQVIQKGFWLKDRLLRPARVIIAK